MCGIWGGSRYKQLDETQLFSRLLAHRGPDHQGAEVLYIDKTGNKLWFGHTRLSVIDTRAVANQPMWSADKQLCIVFNGEIYNFKELRKQYCQDYQFISDSDTEVILALWKRLGPDCLRMFRGIFAFALYDSSSKITYLCRDPLGVKPLYYATSSTGAFAFASEAIALSVMGIGGEIRPEALAEYFYHRYVPGDETIFRGIKRVPPGCYLTVACTGEVACKCYWELPHTADKMSSAEAEGKLDVLLNEAVKSQLVADVPLGIFLSGGIDSSLIASMAVRMLNTTVDTFSVGFEDPHCDETGAAQLVASYLGTKHHQLMFTGSLKDWLPQIIHRLDEPLADPAMIPMYVLSQFARQKVVVALSGDGADELFAGYKQYRLEPMVPLMRKVRPLIYALFRVSGWNERRDRLMRVLDSRKSDHWPEWTGAVSLDLSSGLTRVKYEGEPIHDVSLAERLLEDIKGPLVDRMLMKVDKMSMAHSLEVRVPFLDPKVVDFACRLDVRQKVKLTGDKLILREVAKKYLPPSIVERRKHGFNLPISVWLRGADADFCDDVLFGSRAVLNDWLDIDVVKRLVSEHTNRQSDHGLAIYSLIVLSLWLTEYSNQKRSIV